MARLGKSFSARFVFGRDNRATSAIAAHVEPTRHVMVHIHRRAIESRTMMIMTNMVIINA